MFLCYKNHSLYECLAPSRGYSGAARSGFRESRAPYAASMMETLSDATTDQTARREA